MSNRYKAIREALGLVADKADDVALAGRARRLVDDLGEGTDIMAVLHKNPDIANKVIKDIGVDGVENLWHLREAAKQDAFYKKLDEMGAALDEAPTPAAVMPSAPGVKVTPGSVDEGVMARIEPEAPVSLRQAAGAETVSGTAPGTPAITAPAKNVPDASPGKTGAPDAADAPKTKADADAPGTREKPRIRAEEDAILKKADDAKDNLERAKSDLNKATRTVEREKFRLSKTTGREAKQKAEKSLETAKEKVAAQEVKYQRAKTDFKEAELEAKPIRAQRKAEARTTRREKVSDFFATATGRAGRAMTHVGSALYTMSAPLRWVGNRLIAPKRRIESLAWYSLAAGLLISNNRSGGALVDQALETTADAAKFLKENGLPFHKELLNAALAGIDLASDISIEKTVIQTAQNAYVESVLEKEGLEAAKQASISFQFLDIKGIGTDLTLSISRAKTNADHDDLSGEEEDKLIAQAIINSLVEGAKSKPLGKDKVTETDIIHYLATHREVLSHPLMPDRAQEILMAHSEETREAFETQDRLVATADWNAAIENGRKQVEAGAQGVREKAAQANKLAGLFNFKANNKIITAVGTGLTLLFGFIMGKKVFDSNKAGLVGALGALALATVLFKGQLSNNFNGAAKGEPSASLRTAWNPNPNSKLGEFVTQGPGALAPNAFADVQRDKQPKIAEFNFDGPA